jgi:hypothetical protein
VEGRVLLFGALWFLIHGLADKRIASWIQRERKVSDRTTALGIKIMRPACFVMSAFCLALALKFLTR